jgi:UDP-glucose 4-epimerase
MHWYQVYGLRANSIRIFNAYGTRSRTTGAYGAVIGTFLKQKLSGHPYTVVGDGNQKRDFIYVTDLVKAFFQAATNEEVIGEIFNIGNSNPRSINELVSLLGGEIVYIPKRPGEPDVTHADISKANDLLGWSPEISLEDGIKIVLENIDYWADAPLWTPDKIDIETKSWFRYMS